MKVKELIESLSKFDPEQPVALSDWSEEYRKPSIDWKQISVQTWPYLEWHEDKKEYTREIQTALVLGPYQK